MSPRSLQRREQANILSRFGETLVIKKKKGKKKYNTTSGVACTDVDFLGSRGKKVFSTRAVSH